MHCEALAAATKRRKASLDLELHLLKGNVEWGRKSGGRVLGPFWDVCACIYILACHLLAHVVLAFPVLRKVGAALTSQHVRICLYCRCLHTCMHAHGRTPPDHTDRHRDRRAGLRTYVDEYVNAYLHIYIYIQGYIRYFNRPTYIVNCKGMPAMRSVGTERHIAVNLGSGVEGN